MRARRHASAAPRSPSPSRWLIRAFTAYSRAYFRRHFNTLSLASATPAPTCAGRPLILYLNHASWWDPLTVLLVVRRFYAERTFAVPMDAEALQRYGILRRLGFFPVERDTQRGARQFLRGASAVLADANGGLCLTPQGHFTDVRVRPTRLTPGIAHLAVLAPHAVFVPLAIEYVFWQERLPEALLCFGEPIEAGDASLAILEQRLEQAQDRLAGLAQAQAKGDFTILLSGRAGVGGVYDVWRRASAWLKGQAFDPHHSSR